MRDSIAAPLLFARKGCRSVGRGVGRGFCTTIPLAHQRDSRGTTREARAHCAPRPLFVIRHPSSTLGGEALQEALPARFVVVGADDGEAVARGGEIVPPRSPCAAAGCLLSCVVGAALARLTPLAFQILLW